MSPVPGRCGGVRGVWEWAGQAGSQVQSYPVGVAIWGQEGGAHRGQFPPGADCPSLSQRVTGRGGEGGRREGDGWTLESISPSSWSERGQSAHRIQWPVCHMTIKFYIT